MVHAVLLRPSAAPCQTRHSLLFLEYRLGISTEREGGGGGAEPKLLNLRHHHGVVLGAPGGEQRTEEGEEGEREEGGREELPVDSYLSRKFHHKKTQPAVVMY